MNRHFLNPAFLLIVVGFFRSGFSCFDAFHEQAGARPINAFFDADRLNLDPRLLLLLVLAIILGTLGRFQFKVAPPQFAPPKVLLVIRIPKDQRQWLAIGANVTALTKFNVSIACH
jgi:hypothetical protein